jgi:4-hydroxyproline epimerase
MLEEGLVQPKVPGKLRLETPAGLVKIEYKQEGKKVTSVKLTNIPSFLAAENLKVECSQFGELVVDVAYGGNFYAIVDPQENYKDLADHSALELIGASREIRTHMNEHYQFNHPENPTISGLSHLLWTGQPTQANSTARNAVFYGEKAIDRSPCGTGTSARMAQWAAKGKLKEGDEFVHESIIGSQFIGRIEGTTQIGEKSAIIPSIEGWAKITGYNTILIDEDDPYAFGFSVI